MTVDERYEKALKYIEEINKLFLREEYPEDFSLEKVRCPMAIISSLEKMSDNLKKSFRVDRRIYPSFFVVEILPILEDLLKYLHKGQSILPPQEEELNND